MQTDTRLGTFDDVTANASDEVRDIAHFLRSIIRELHPDAIEVPRPGEPAASYGLGPKKMSEAYAYIMPLTDRVNLGFYHGVDVDDSDGLLEGGGKRLRHVKLASLEAASRPAIRKLIIDSIAERRSALGR